MDTNSVTNLMIASQHITSQAQEWAVLITALSTAIATVIGAWAHRAGVVTGQNQNGGK
jgi:hypothetical protein